MPFKQILLLDEDPSLLSILKEGFSENGAAVTSYQEATQNGMRIHGQSYPLVVVEARKNWTGGIKKFCARRDQHDTCFLVAPAPVLKSLTDKIQDLFLHLKEKRPQGSRSAKKIKNVYLEDLVEQKLKEFLKRMRSSGNRNIYNMLMMEFERPLIQLTLKETEGNQIKAAELLGMNRNTLRKKIQKLKIPLQK
jgi:two-component system nitrogen regulation response regulator GlnG